MADESLTEPLSAPTSVPTIMPSPPVTVPLWIWTLSMAPPTPTWPNRPTRPFQAPIAPDWGTAAGALITRFERVLPRPVNDPVKPLIEVVAGSAMGEPVNGVLKKSSELARA